MKWQPIDTAPKDGTTILLYDSIGMGSGRWVRNDWEADWSNYYDVNPDATHWMPLPNPPVPNDD